MTNAADGEPESPANSVDPGMTTIHIISLPQPWPVSSIVCVVEEANFGHLSIYAHPRGHFFAEVLFSGVIHSAKSKKIVAESSRGGAIFICTRFSSAKGHLSLIVGDPSNDKPEWKVKPSALDNPEAVAPAVTEHPGNVDAKRKREQSVGDANLDTVRAANDLRIECDLLRSALAHVESGELNHLRLVSLHLRKILSRKNKGDRLLRSVAGYMQLPLTVYMPVSSGIVSEMLPHGFVFAADFLAELSAAPSLGRTLAIDIEAWFDLEAHWFIERSFTNDQLFHAVVDKIGGHSDQLRKEVDVMSSSIIGGRSNLHSYLVNMSNIALALCDSTLLSYEINRSIGNL